MPTQAPVPSIKNYLKDSISKHKLEYWGVTTLSLLQTTVNLAIPFLFVKSCETTPGEEDNRLPWLLGLCAAVFASNALAELRKEIITPIGSELGGELGAAVVEAYYALPLKRYISPANSSMVNYFGASILRISRAFIDGLHTEIVPSLLETTGASILISVRFGVVGAIVSGALAAHLLVLLAASPRMITAQNEYMKQMYGAMDDAITQVGQYTNVNIFNAAKTQLAKLAALLKEFGKATDRSILMKSRVQLLSAVVHVMSLLGVGLLSIYKSDKLSSNDMLWVFIYLRQIAPSFEKLSQAINELLAEREFFKGTVEYIKDGYDYRDTGKPALIVTEEIANIRFKDVMLHYEGLKHPAVKQLTFDIAPGEFVVITGTSGAGKTSILSMLEKFYNPNQGEILLADTNIANVSTESVRKTFAVVPQDSVLMNVSLKKNIAFANPQATDEEILQAIRFAGLMRVLRKHNDNPLGVGGGKLSGGQRQRVAIARAYVRNAKYLFLDEPTAALDPQTEEEIFSKLTDLVDEKKCTTILVTHRLAALKKMPTITKIIVMHEGEIVEQGPLKTLEAIPNGYFASQMQVALAQEKLETVTKARSKSLGETYFTDDEGPNETEMQPPDHITLNMDDPAGLAEGSTQPLLSKAPPAEKKPGSCVLL